jgi:vacuolar iron transporter family protein
MQMPSGWVADRWARATAGGYDGPWVRSMIVEVNDGIIATAGVVEGFAGAGASMRTIAIGAVSAMVAGAIALGGARYAEEAAERDARLALIAEERRQHALSPAAEIAELTALYEARGLSPRLASEVAVELSERDALAAHIEAEHGLSIGALAPAPVVTAIAAGLAFALGAAVPLVTVLLAPDAWRVAVTFATVVLSLALTSVVVAATGRTHVIPTVVRSVLIGVAAMLLTLAAGSLFHP